jgi:hypothetical protein
MTKNVIEKIENWTNNEVLMKIFKPLNSFLIVFQFGDKGYPLLTIGFL